jgi:hypothetical protein
MAEATLRGYIEVPSTVAKQLAKAGWPVEIRHFIPKAGTKAVSLPKTNGHSEHRTVTPNSKNNLLTIGAVSPETLAGDRHKVGVAAIEALQKMEHKRARRLTLKKHLIHKTKLTNKQVSSQLTHLVRLSVLVDLGKFPPEWDKRQRTAAQA